MTLLKIEEDNKHLTIISGLHAVKNKSSPCRSIFNRCDRGVMKRKGIFFCMKREHFTV